MSCAFLRPEPGWRERAAIGRCTHPHGRCLVTRLFCSTCHGGPGEKPMAFTPSPRPTRACSHCERPFVRRAVERGPPSICPACFRGIPPGARRYRRRNWPVEKRREFVGKITRGGKVTGYWEWDGDAVGKARWIPRHVDGTIMTPGGRRRG